MDDESQLKTDDLKQQQQASNIFVDTVVIQPQEQQVKTENKVEDIAPSSIITNTITDTNNPTTTTQPQKIVITREKNSITVFLTGFLNATKILGLLVWYLFRSFLSKIYTRQKVIRNQVVLITGSGGYLGRQLACELSKHGVSLVLWDSNEVENQKTYEALRALGHRRIYLHKVDLTNEDQVRDCAAKVKAKHGYISMIVFAAATVCDLKTILEVDDNENKSKEYHDKHLVKSFRLFYESHLWVYQEFLPKMIEKNAGHIVLISSEAVLYNLPLISTYSSLQQAQLKLVDCVNAELNSNKKNQIKSSVVYLGRLKKGIVKELSVRLHSNTDFVSDIDSDDAAKRIIKAVLKNKTHIFLPSYLNFIYMLKTILPTKCFDLLFSANNYMDTETLVNYSIHKKND